MFQVIYDWIKGIKTPLWLKTILGQIQVLIMTTLINIGKDFIIGLENKIIEVENTDWSSDRKYKEVFKWCQENAPDLKESLINMLIEIVLQLLKQRSFARVI